MSLWNNVDNTYTVPYIFLYVGCVDIISHVDLRKYVWVNMGSDNEYMYILHNDHRANSIAITDGLLVDVTQHDPNIYRIRQDEVEYDNYGNPILTQNMSCDKLIIARFNPNDIIMPSWIDTTLVDVVESNYWIVGKGCNNWTSSLESSRKTKVDRILDASKSSIINSVLESPLITDWDCVSAYGGNIYVVATPRDIEHIIQPFEVVRPTFIAVDDSYRLVTVNDLATPDVKWWVSFNGNNLYFFVNSKAFDSDVEILDFVFDKGGVFEYRSIKDEIPKIAKTIETLMVEIGSGGVRIPDVVDKHPCLDIGSSKYPNVVFVSDNDILSVVNIQIANDSSMHEMMCGIMRKYLETNQILGADFIYFSNEPRGK